LTRETSSSNVGMRQSVRLSTRLAAQKAAPCAWVYVDDAMALSQIKPDTLSVTTPATVVSYDIWFGRPAAIEFGILKLQTFVSITQDPALHA
jgi:hypothetical protein